MQGNGDCETRNTPQVCGAVFISASASLNTRMTSPLLAHMYRAPGSRLAFTARGCTRLHRQERREEEEKRRKRRRRRGEEACGYVEAPGRGVPLGSASALRG